MLRKRKDKMIKRKRTLKEVENQREKKKQYKKLCKERNFLREIKEENNNFILNTNNETNKKEENKENKREVKKFNTKICKHDNLNSECYQCTKAILFALRKKWKKKNYKVLPREIYHLILSFAFPSYSSIYPYKPKYEIKQPICNRCCTFMKIDDNETGVIVYQSSYDTIVILGRYNCYNHWYNSYYLTFCDNTKLSKVSLTRYQFKKLYFDSFSSFDLDLSKLKFCDNCIEEMKSFKELRRK